uniref:Uncharacterized protein n=1 Tax=Arundo donax TaxID=35708 RepID=A0A0A9GBD6_ARUDO
MYIHVLMQHWTWMVFPLVHSPYLNRGIHSPPLLPQEQARDDWQERTPPSA